MSEDPRPAPRSRDNHPGERRQDGPFGWLLGRENWYRDVWLFLISIVLVIGVKANKDRVADIQSSRVEAVRTSCEKTNDVIRGYNLGQDLLARLVVASVLSPGDRPVPAGERDPFKWKAIKDGPLSLQVQRQIDGYPDATARLKRAQDQARQLQSRKIHQRDCDADVADVKKAGRF